MNTVMNFWVPQKAENILAGQMIFLLLEKTHEVSYHLQPRMIVLVFTRQTLRQHCHFISFHLNFQNKECRLTSTSLVLLNITRIPGFSSEGKIEVTLGLHTYTSITQ